MAGDNTFAKAITKGIAKQKKWDKQQSILQQLREEVLPKNRWHQIKELKSAYKPTPFSRRRGEHRQHVPK
eukprot:12935640-Prorocentrum_lima.AAC.1